MFQKIKTFVLAFFLEHAIVLEEQAYHSYETIEKRAESADTEYLARILKGEELKQLLRLREIQKYSYVDQECTAMTNMDTLLETVKRGQAKDESGKVMEFRLSRNINPTESRLSKPLYMVVFYNHYM